MREEGYYFVKFKPGYGWTIAYYTGSDYTQWDDWHFCMDTKIYKEEDLFEIGSKIELPK